MSVNVFHLKLVACLHERLHTMHGIPSNNMTSCKKLQLKNYRCLPLPNPLKSKASTCFSAALSSMRSSRHKPVPLQTRQRTTRWSISVRIIFESVKSRLQANFFTTPFPSRSDESKEGVRHHVSLGRVSMAHLCLRAGRLSNTFRDAFRTCQLR